MLFFPLYITAWASSLLLNVNNNTKIARVARPVYGASVIGL